MSRADPSNGYVVADSLSAYLDDIGHHPLLDRREEIELGRRIRTGDRDAIDALVCANLRFVVVIAKKFQGRSVPLLDLIAEGNVGLIRAAHRFDETKGIKFISYAVWWIRQAIVHALAAEACIVHVPPHRAATLRRIGRRANSLLQQLGREPTHKEIADEMDITEEEVATTMAISQRQLSLDAPMISGQENELLDYVPDKLNPSPDEEMVGNALTNSIEEALANLRDRDARIIRLYFGFDGQEPLTLEQIGALLGITRERVRQVRDRTLRTLRTSIPELALAG